MSRGVVSLSWWVTTITSFQDPRLLPFLLQCQPSLHNSSVANSTAITAKLMKHTAAAEHLATQGGEDYSREYSTRKGTQPGIETLSRGVAPSSHDAVQYRPIFTVAMQHAMKTYRRRGGKKRRRLNLCIRNVASYGSINHLTPNAAPLTSKRCILYIY